MTFCIPASVFMTRALISDSPHPYLPCFAPHCPLRGHGFTQRFIFIGSGTHCQALADLGAM
eukprot:3519706-Alexandrium_andersonii.AAC.1